MNPQNNSSSDNQSIKEQVKDFIWESLKVIIISLLIIIPVRYFLIQPFYVKGASMEPNFYDHEYLIIDEISYRFEDPKRGDVVVFRYPDKPDQFFIKRIIGLPSEKVVIEDGRVKIGNMPEGDLYILDETQYLPDVYTQGEADVILGNDEYYVLGDNRSSSLDSRVFGPIHKDAIIGRAWIRGWPFDRIDMFESPSY